MLQLIWDKGVVKFLHRCLVGRVSVFTHCIIPRWENTRKFELWGNYFGDIRDAMVGQSLLKVVGSGGEGHAVSFCSNFHQRYRQIIHFKRCYVNEEELLFLDFCHSTKHVRSQRR